MHCIVHFVVHMTEVNLPVKKLGSVGGNLGVFMCFVGAFFWCEVLFVWFHFLLCSRP